MYSDSKLTTSLSLYLASRSASEKVSYFIVLTLLNPTLGTRRYHGFCPPSKPNLTFERFF